MSLVSLVRGRRGKSGFGYASTAEEVTRGLDLSGKRILITGANSGLGAESARVLAARGAQILAAARTMEKAEAACADLPNDPVPLECELSEPFSVHACVAAVQALGEPVDVLLCNAGIMMIPDRTVKYGQELQMLTNHFGHFILVTGLLDQLSEDGRVVMLSSTGHQMAPSGGIDFDDLSLARSYDRIRAYGQSKLANLLFARALSERLPGPKQTANALHPGVIHTNLGRHMPLPMRMGSAAMSVVGFKSVPEGAATQCYVAAHPDAATLNGLYFADCNVARSSRHGRDMALANRLWDVSEAVVADLG